MPGHTFETFKDLGLQGTTFKPRVPPVCERVFTRQKPNKVAWPRSAGQGGVSGQRTRSRSSKRH